MWRRAEVLAASAPTVCFGCFESAPCERGCGSPQTDQLGGVRNFYSLSHPKSMAQTSWQLILNYLEPTQFVTVVILLNH